MVCSTLGDSSSWRWRRHCNSKLGFVRILGNLPDCTDSDELLKSEWRGVWDNEGVLTVTEGDFGCD